MGERFSQPNTRVHPEGPNSDFIGVINSLALSPQKKQNIIERVRKLEGLHWTKGAIANELELRFHIKMGERKNPTS